MTATKSQAHAAKASEVQAPKRPASPPDGAATEPRPLDVNKAKQLQASGAEVAVTIQAVNKCALCAFAIGE